MALRLTQTTGPTDEPVTLDDMKRHLRVTINEDDLTILVMMQAARDHIERVTRRQLMTATWVLALDVFPSQTIIELPRPPLQGITSLEYLDADNVTQVMEAEVDYSAETVSEPGRLYLLPGISWPSTYDVPNAVKITYLAGWSSSALVPASLRMILFMLVAHLYENREATSIDAISHALPFVHDFLTSHRVPTRY